MNAAQKANTVLIADPDPVFLEKVQNQFPTKTNLRLITAPTGHDAQRSLEDPSLKYSGAIINLNLTKSSGLSVLRYIFQNKPAIPLYVIYDQECPLRQEDLIRLGVNEAFRKPHGEDLAVELLSHLGLLSEEIAKSTQANPTKANLQLNNEIDGAKSQIPEKDFLQIRIEDCRFGPKLNFDIFIRLSKDHFIKLFPKHEEVSLDRIQNFSKKGITHLYIHKDDQIEFIDYIGNVAEATLQDKNASRISVSRALAGQADTVMKFIKKTGIHQEHIRFSTRFIDNIAKVTQEFDMTNGSFLKDFLDDIILYEHGISTAYVAAMLSKPMGLEFPKLVRSLGLAALFHDIGLSQSELYENSPALAAEDVNRMNEEERTIYFSHPTVGAEMLRRIQGVDPVVVQAIAQHHERHNKSGFPNGIGRGQIHMISEVVGLSDQFCMLIAAAKMDPTIDPFKEIEKVTHDCYSARLTEAFSNVFLFRLFFL